MDTGCDLGAEVFGAKVMLEPDAPDKDPVLVHLYMRCRPVLVKQMLLFPFSYHRCGFFSSCLVGFVLLRSLAFCNHVHCVTV